VTKYLFSDWTKMM